MPFSLLIDGVERRANLQKGSLRIRDTINAPSTVSMLLKDEAGVYRPGLGQAVQIYDEAGDLVFGGSIDEPDEEALPAGPLYTTVQCMDHHHLAEKRLVAETYEATAAGVIVQDIISQVLSQEGITAGTIQAGPTIAKAVFNYIRAAQALDELSDLTGYQWVIRPNMGLDFFDRSTFAAPWIAEPATVMSPKVHRDRHEYRNRQYVRAGYDVTDPRTEEFVGDGKIQTFTLKFPVAEAPSIEVNGLAQTVGIHQVETGKGWYWNKNSREVIQDDGDTPLSSTDTLAVTYRGLFPIRVVADSSVAMTERKTVEGGSGIYEHVLDAPNINSQDAAIEYAQGQLRRFARISTVLTYETFASDLRVGMLQPVNLPAYDLSGDFLISEIETYDVRRGDNVLRRRVTALSGEAVGGWRRFFRESARQGRQYVIRENEVLVKMKIFAEVLRLTDTFTKSSAAPESRAGYAMVGYAEVS